MYSNSQHFLADYGDFRNAICACFLFFNSCIAHMDGQIWFLTRSLQLSSFQAYKLRVTHLYQLKQHNILVSVGQDEHGINPLVRFITGVCSCMSVRF